MITVTAEKTLDYAEVAALATEAFGGRRFDSREIQWLYERCFSSGTTVVTARENDRKIGQCAMVQQSIVMEGVCEHAVQIVDLFVAKAFRSRGLVRQLYDEAERQCIAQKIRFALGMPNAKAISVNERFFKLRPFLRLPVRIGLAMPLRSPSLIASAPFDPAKAQQAIGLLGRYRTPREENGIPWDGESLYQRLCSPTRGYGLHATDDLLLISSARTSRHVRYTLLGAFFIRSGTRPTAASVRSVIRAACHLWNRPLFAFVGFNNALPGAPGVPLPAWLRRSPMLLQLRDFQPNRPEPRFDRFQALDFDFG